jgi:hypothetical protein
LHFLVIRGHCQIHSVLFSLCFHRVVLSWFLVFRGKPVSQLTRKDHTL